MEQPAPTTAQNTNDDEDDEELFDEEEIDESPTLTLAPIDRRDDTTIDVNAKCLGPLRGFQGVKAAVGRALRYLTLDTPDDYLQTLKAQIYVQRRKNVDTAAHTYLHCLSRRGVGASARDAAYYDDVRHASLKHLEKHYKQNTISSSELRDVERNLKRISDFAKQDAALLKSWDASANRKQREEKAIEEMEDVGLINWGALSRRSPAVFHASLTRRVEVLEEIVDTCVEINQCVGYPRQFFTKSFLGDDAAVLAPSSGEEPTSPRHRAGVASMAWRTTR